MAVEFDARPSAEILADEGTVENRISHSLTFKKSPVSRGKSHRWTEADDTVIREDWPNGIRAQVIAAKLGDNLTANAITKRAGRLDLKRVTPVETKRAAQQRPVSQAQWRDPFRVMRLMELFYAGAYVDEIASELHTTEAAIELKIKRLKLRRERLPKRGKADKCKSKTAPQSIPTPPACGAHVGVIHASSTQVARPRVGLRSCTEIDIRTGERCPHEAIPGTAKCEEHGGSLTYAVLHESKIVYRPY